MERGKYREIVKSSIAPRTLKVIRNLVNGAANAEKVHEHGAWEFGAEFDSKGRGGAVNWDVYGYGRDVHSHRFMAVIQVRSFERRGGNGYSRIKKSYFLLGRNEDDSIFAHSIESRVVHAAARKDKNVVLAVQNWIFGGDYKRMLRQGDMALLPLKSQPNLKGAVRLESPISLTGEDGSQGSHTLTANKIYKNGALYAYKPFLLHQPGTHPSIVVDGWCKVIVGKRADFWDFAAPTID